MKAKLLLFVVSLLFITTSCSYDHSKKWAKNWRIDEMEWVEIKCLEEGLNAIELNKIVQLSYHCDEQNFLILDKKDVSDITISEKENYFFLTFNYTYPGYSSCYSISMLDKCEFRGDFGLTATKRIISMVEADVNYMIKYRQIGRTIRNLSGEDGEYVLITYWNGTTPSFSFEKSE